MEYYLALKRNEAKSSPCLPKLEKRKKTERKPVTLKDKGHSTILGTVTILAKLQDMRSDF